MAIFDMKTTPRRYEIDISPAPQNARDTFCIGLRRLTRRGRRECLLRDQDARKHGKGRQLNLELLYE